MEPTFRTELKIKASASPLTIGRPIVLIGSCFTDNIGGRLRYSMWDACVNPCGVLYNPASIARILKLAINDSKIGAKDLCESSGTWFSYYFSTKFSHPDPETALKMMNDAINELRRYILSAQALIVTFGTSFVFSLNDSGFGIVGNCHKMPSTMFTRRRMEVQEIVGEWTGLIRDLRDINPEIRIIFTVSPIRHVRDGFENNTISKSTLILAVNELCSKVSATEYFPAFEIMNDDLRDYRFYAGDMAHPNDTAIDYIWSKFQQRFFTEETHGILVQAGRLRSLTLHRPNTPDESRFMKFQKQTKEKVDAFLSIHPYLKF